MRRAYGEEILVKGGLEMLQMKGRDFLALKKNEKDRVLDGAFHYWRDQGFPYYKLSSEDILREYRNLCRQVPRPVSKEGLDGAVTGLRLANFYQPQMWSVRVNRYLSPMDVFRSDALLRAAIRRSWSIWPDRCGANPATLRRMLKTFPGAASVSNFRPTIARALVDRFSAEGGTVIDFAAGFGGRLLGCVTVNRRYIGIEPCAAQVSGLKDMIEALRSLEPAGRAEVLQGCAEDVMRLLPRGRADLVFSSPPYFDWERYSDECTQSFLRYASYEQWKSGFLAPVLQQSYRVLRNGGRLVLNISGRRRKPEIGEVRDLARSAGFRFSAVIPLLVSRVPYLHPRESGPHKHETLLVLTKPGGAKQI